MELKENLLNEKAKFFEKSDNDNSFLSIRGLYNSMQFVLRLDPDLHALLDKIPNAIVKYSDIDFDTFQAFSTYLHESIHWWQHIGSSTGLLLSLSYPAQVHLNHKLLKDFLNFSGKKKSILEYNKIIGNQPDNTGDEIKTINSILNNFFDIEFYRALIINPYDARQIVNSPYFECRGHSYRMAYSSVNWLLAATFDREFKFIPDIRLWDERFQKLKEAQVEEYYYGSKLELAPIGLKELFEGQARFSQLQYLHFGSGGELDLDNFRAANMLSDVYVKAFELFIQNIKSNWPKSINSPIVALFLLVCDISINPSEGFPFDISHFETFITDADPGMRFLSLCHTIANQFPHFKEYIKNYSKAEYLEVSDKLCKALRYRSPIEASHKVINWSQECPQLVELGSESKSFKFSDENLPIRVVFDRFLRLSEDKINYPEFFCWPGAWMAGQRVSAGIVDMFLKHQALFCDKADGDIYPRSFPDKDETVVQQTFNSFYVWNITYDLCRQWIVKKGQFEYFFFWLSNKFTTAEYRQWATENFKQVYGVNPEEFEILQDMS